MLASVKFPITDDLLSVAVRIRREAGVSHGDIQAVIDRHACEQRWQERTGGIGFPLVEDIPQTSRSEFLAMLSDLAPDSGGNPKYAAQRSVSVAEIWPSKVL